MDTLEDFLELFDNIEKEFDELNFERDYVMGEISSHYEDMSYKDMMNLSNEEYYFNL